VGLQGRDVAPVDLLIVKGKGIILNHQKTYSSSNHLKKQRRKQDWMSERRECWALTCVNYRETKGWFRQLLANVKDIQIKV
jgi:hypothetical protein